MVYLRQNATLRLLAQETDYGTDRKLIEKCGYISLTIENRINVCTNHDLMKQEFEMNNWLLLNA